MITMLFSAILASVLHVISGPDHLAAVTPLAISSQRNGWKVGLVWGLGHLLGMLLIGILFMLFKEMIPIDAISSYSEQLVAIVLIIVGLWALYRVFNESKKGISNNEAQKVGYKNQGEEHLYKNKLKLNLLSSFSIGFIHGLAGVSHFILLLPVLAFETSSEAFQYLLGFAIGTVAAMMTYALILGRIAALTKKLNDSNILKVFRISGALFAVFIGIYWFYLTF